MLHLDQPSLLRVGSSSIESMQDLTGRGNNLAEEVPTRNKLGWSRCNMVAAFDRAVLTTKGGSRETDMQP